jgi:hypothetical protein
MTEVTELAQLLMPVSLHHHASIPSQCCIPCATRSFLPTFDKAMSLSCRFFQFMDESVDQELSLPSQSQSETAFQTEDQLPVLDVSDDASRGHGILVNDPDVKPKLEGADHSTAASIFSEFASGNGAVDACSAPFDIESILAARIDISQSVAEFLTPPPRVDTGVDNMKNLFSSSLIPTSAQADVNFLIENPYASLRWTALITKLGDSGSQWPSAFVRNVLSSCLRVYRRSPNVWLLYIKHLWDSRDLALAMKQFQTALHICPHVDLFRVYLKCVRVIFQDKFQDSSARELLRHAHEFAVEKIGMDVHSLPIWQDYFALLKELNLETEVLLGTVFFIVKVHRIILFTRLTCFSGTSGFQTMHRNSHRRCRKSQK